MVGECDDAPLAEVGHVGVVPDDHRVAPLLGVAARTPRHHHRTAKQKPSTKHFHLNHQKLRFIKWYFHNKRPNMTRNENEQSFPRRDFIFFSKAVRLT